MEKIIKRLKNKIKIKDNGCWIWTGAKGPKGSGTMRINGKVTSPRRVSYYIHNGPIPNGRNVNPTCGNRLCINPEHLSVTNRKRKSDPLQKSILPFYSEKLRERWENNNYEKQVLKRIIKKIKIDDGTECWIWTGAKGAGGYGNTYYNGKYVNSHRLMYQIFIGKVPKDKHVCHTCDNKLCINPEHLFVGTQKDNHDDMLSKKRQSCGKSHSDAIKKGWKPETRKRHSNYMKKRREKEHNARADAAGVPRDYKFCPKCEQWFPRTYDYWNKNSARYDGLKVYCKSCS